MKKVLVLFAHPALEKSVVHSVLIESVRKLEGVTFVDLYQEYPEFDIDILREQKRLMDHDVVVWQHPFYWYSAPPVFKQWQDLVLEHGWAYGKSGTALKGKAAFSVITTGSTVEDYRYDGFQKYTIEEYLRPYERTAGLCNMDYWPPYWIPGTFILSKEKIREYSDNYVELLKGISSGKLIKNISSVKLMNELFVETKTPA